MKYNKKQFYVRLFSEIRDELLEEIKQNLISMEVKSEDLDLPMTSIEICKYYKISNSTLERYIRQGLSFNRKRKNCKRFFTRREFNNFINQNKKRN